MFKKLRSSRVAATLATLGLVPLAVVVTASSPAHAVVTTVSNTTPITINDNADANPYPSSIAVSGLSGDIQNVAVTLTGLSHPYLRDVGVVLVAPNNDALLIMDYVGAEFGTTSVSDVTLAITDSAAAQMSDTAVPTTGSYRPTTFFADDSFPTPGPGLAYGNPGPVGGSATFASVFGGDAPNGTWSLFVRDFSSGDAGTISGGWTLTINTTPAAPSLSALSPTSPNTATTVAVKGSAEPGSTVKLYLTTDCSGSPAATGTAADLAGAGIEVPVTPNATSTIKATATDSLSTSACSPGLTYTNDSVAPAPPTGLSVTPSSPASSTTPAVKGAAEDGSTVKVYTTASCSGPPAATGTAGMFGSSGLPVIVTAGSTTTFRATATDAVGNTSACSAGSVTYVQQNPTPAVPDTTLTKTPKKQVTTTKSKAKVSFEFSSATAGATFECSIDGQAFVACTSGQTFKLKAGKHTFAVRAVSSGQTDPTPATYGFKVKRKH